MYDIGCQACDKTYTVFLRLADYNNIPRCSCGGTPFRRILAPAIQAGFTPYRSPATGKIIESPNAQREDLRRSGCILNEPGLDRDVKRWGTETQDRAFAPISKGVDSVITQLVNSGQIES